MTAMDKSSASLDAWVAVIKIPEPVRVPREIANVIAAGNISCVMVATDFERLLGRARYKTSDVPVFAS